MERGRFIYKYSRWDGTQLPRTDLIQARNQLIEDYLNFGDFRFAFNWQIRQGIPPIAFEGLNNLALRLRKKRAELLSQFNARGLVEQFNQWLDEIIEKELEKINELERELSGAQLNRLKELFEKESFLRNLKGGLRERIAGLKEYKFESEEAQREFENLLEYFEQLKRFMFSSFFAGNQDMSLEEAMELALSLKRLENLLKALERGEILNVNLADLEEFLGEETRKSIERLLEFMEFLKESGFVLESGAETQLSAKAIRLIGEKALADIFQMVSPELLGRHNADKGGEELVIPDQSRPFQFGDRLQLHLVRTVKNALVRICQEEGFSSKQNLISKLRLNPEDFEVVESEYESRSATVLMLDLSLSMFQTGRFLAAKKVALALEHLIRTKFPRDYFYLIGFATYARILTRKELIEATSGLGDDIFTNIQQALELARRLLSRHKNLSRQIILITDGQPTAFFREGKLYIEWPYFGVAPEANQETLKEVKRVTSAGIIINTFMLDRSPPLVEFVEELTRINRGRAFFTTPEKLGRYLLVDFLARKKRIIH